jgi:hypothetical protein
MTVVCDNHCLVAHIGRLAGLTRIPEEGAHARRGSGTNAQERGQTEGVGRGPERHEVLDGALAQALTETRMIAGHRSHKS